jgi:2-polyprenyl-3-methyl-5-hydroxy-6-metoxy-1,4-benzoquinol methylase
MSLICLEPFLNTQRFSLRRAVKFWCLSGELHKRWHANSKATGKVMSSHTDQQELFKINEVWGDPDRWEADGLQWTRLDAVRAMINRHVTGDPGKAPLDWFMEKVAAEGKLPFENVLVLACGGGEFERGLVRSGYVRNVTAIDISEDVIEVARSRALAEGMDTITYRTGDMNALDVEGTFDAVFSVSAIHHCAAIEDLLVRIEALLVPEGWFYVDEYIGPDRFQWTDRQVLEINRLLDSLPDRFVANLAGYSRRNFVRVSAETVAEFDPSEAIRSSEIPDLVRAAFKIEAARGYGGALLQSCLANIAQNFLEATGTAIAAEEYLDHVIEASDRSRLSGRTTDDFMVMLARRR